MRVRGEWWGMMPYSPAHLQSYCPPHGLGRRSGLSCRGGGTGGFAGPRWQRGLWLGGRRAQARKWGLRIGLGRGRDWLRRRACHHHHPGTPHQTRGKLHGRLCHWHHHHHHLLRLMLVLMRMLLLPPPQQLPPPLLLRHWSSEQG